MATFMGMFDYSIDSKGRISIPQKMRKNIKPEAKETFVATRGFEKCIAIYPLDEWENIEKKLSSLNSFKEKDRLFQRTFLMWASHQELDSQSRITLPKTLLDYAGIKSEVKIIGVGERIEVWDPEAFDKYLNSQSEGYEAIAEQVMGLGI
ncbi:MAG TPA: division/cell wall cluster transcriptional repressor MraZ [Bacteroidota bacterium]|jgi:MraZ protein|nr:division/cell wall cluster transcriptional repressor MraZ [Bacteroidota bacterium]